jgi:hypothetical protein
MNLGPDLWRNLDGSVVVSTLISRPGLLGTYDIHHRPADEEDQLTYFFLKPEHEETEPCFE